jgi:hypothetical protein
MRIETPQCELRGFFMATSNRFSLPPTNFSTSDTSPRITSSSSKAIFNKSAG